MAGMNEEEFSQIAKEIQDAWRKAESRDAAFQVIVDYGRKYGYKNVIAAIQDRKPKRFTKEKPVDEWVEDRRREEAVE
jgi:hypothetical protein